MKVTENTNKATLKSAIYDVGFILSYISAQVYHYFEYFQNKTTEYFVFIFLVLITFLSFNLRTEIQKIWTHKVKFSLFKLNLVFLIFLFCLLGFILIDWPYGANHVNFNTFLIFILLILYGLNFYTFKTLRLNLLHNHKFLLYSICILYFCAGLHKMNFDFYDPEKSCANWYHIKFFKRFMSQISLEQLPEFIKVLSPKLVSFIELLAPLLLLTKFTRLYGIYLLILIHSYLALGGFSDFSSLAFSVLLLYFPIAFLNNKWWLIKINYYFFSSYIVIGISLISSFFFKEHRQQLQTLQGLILILSVFYILNLTKLKRSTVQFEKKAFKKRELIVFIPLLLLLLFGLSPYFGFRSGGTFTMFSNLKLIGNSNNHFFMQKFGIFQLENEVYQIINFSDKSMFIEIPQAKDWITKSGLNLAYNKAIKNEKASDFFITLKDINGTIINLNLITAHDFLGPKKSWLFYKTYMYSFLPDQGQEEQCRW